MQVNTLHFSFNLLLRGNILELYHQITVVSKNVVPPALAHKLCSISISNPWKAKVRYKRKEKEINFPSLKCYHDLVRTVKNKRKRKIQGAKTIFHAMAASSWYSFLEKGSQLGQSLYSFFEDFINLLFFSPPPNFLHNQIKKKKRKRQRQSRNLT